MIEFLFWEMLQKIPGILLIRICLYMTLAVFGGAGILYDKYLNPFLTKYEQKIDDGIELIKAKASYYFGVAVMHVVDFAKTQFFAFLAHRSQPAPPPEPKPKPEKEEASD